MARPKNYKKRYWFWKNLISLFTGRECIPVYDTFCTAKMHLTWRSKIRLKLYRIGLVKYPLKSIKDMVDAGIEVTFEGETLNIPGRLWFKPLTVKEKA